MGRSRYVNVTGGTGAVTIAPPTATFVYASGTTSVSAAPTITLTPVGRSLATGTYYVRADGFSAPGFNTPLSPSQEAELRRDWERRIKAEERDQAAFEAEHPEAVERARALLWRFLNARQREEWEGSGFRRFTVKDARQDFVLERRRAGNITWVPKVPRAEFCRRARKVMGRMTTKKGRRHAARMLRSEREPQNLCVFTKQIHPLEDQLLAQLLTITRDREHFWRVVNRHDFPLPTLEECFA